MQAVAEMHHERPEDSSEEALLRPQIEEIQSQMVTLLDKLELLAAQCRKTANIDESILFLKRALRCISLAPDEDDGDWLDEIDWTAFGQRLVQRREAAKIQQKELAALVNVSSQTIRNIESAVKRPGRDLLLRLLAVPELKLHVSDITGEESRPTLVLTSWLDPRYDPHKMLTDMSAKLNGSGDSLEQSTAYLDSRSAVDWLAISSAPGFLALYSNQAPLRAAAEIVTADFHRGILEVCALGSGDGRRETIFAQYCAERIANPSDLHLYLLDISHTLLTEGYNHARKVLGPRGVRVLMMHANFLDLSRYPVLEKQPKKGSAVRVFTMLGNTLANLDNEVRFFRDTLSGCVTGDYFLADFTAAHASAEDPEEIRRKDPVLQAPVPAVRANWLGGPLRRYCKDVRDVEFTVELDTHCTVRGSYEIIYVAKAKLGGGKPDRRFAMFRCKMYDPPKLIECLEGLGWKCESLMPYATNERNKIMLMLLRKQ